MFLTINFAGMMRDDEKNKGSLLIKISSCLMGGPKSDLYRHTPLRRQVDIQVDLLVALPSQKNSCGIVFNLNHFCPSFLIACCVDGRYRADKIPCTATRSGSRAPDITARPKSTPTSLNTTYQ